MSAGCDRAGWQADSGRAGSATLVLGRATVSAPIVTATSLIFLSPQGAPLAPVYVVSLTPGTGFVIGSLNLTDTCPVGWHIIEPGS